MATYSSRIEAASAARWNWGSGLITREPNSKPNITDTNGTSEIVGVAYSM